MHFYILLIQVKEYIFIKLGKKIRAVGTIWTEMILYKVSSSMFVFKYLHLGMYGFQAFMYSSLIFFLFKKKI